MLGSGSYSRPQDRLSLTTYRRITITNRERDHVTELYRLGVLCLIYIEHPLKIEQYRVTNIYYDYIVMIYSIVTKVSSNLRS